MKFENILIPHPIHYKIWNSIPSIMIDLWLILWFIDVSMQKSENHLEVSFKFNTVTEYLKKWGPLRSKVHNLSFEQIYEPRTLITKKKKKIENYATAVKTALNE